MVDRRADASRGGGAVGPTQPPLLAQWTQLMDGKELHAPAARSGHAMALLAPSQSVLLFGGSNGKVFFDDFHVLEPMQYASLETGGRQAKQKAKAKMRRVSGDRLSQLSQSSQHSQSSQPTTANDLEGERPTLVWKKLLVSRAQNKASGLFDAGFPASSFGSDGSSESPRGIVAKPPGSTPTKTGATTAIALDAHLGSGRDYHTMHYVPSLDEKQLGYRVMVVGNVVVSSDDDEDNGRGASQQPPDFDTEEMRIDELRVKQPQLTAQWVTRTVKSMWKPHARNGHCSALLGDQLFCFGGKNATVTAFYNDFFYFDVGLNQWREQASTGNAPSPRAFADMAASATHEQLFVYGGHDSKRQFGGMFMYDVRNCRWDKILSLGDKPETRINHTLTQLTPEHLVLFGGRKRTSRRNDVFLYDIASMTWKQLGAQTSRRRDHGGESQSESQLTTHHHVVLTQSSVSSAAGTTPKDYPSGRTAHSAVLFESPNRSKHDQQPKKQIMVFGGYAGSHTWLNDLHMLEVDPITVLTKAKPSESALSTSSYELVVARGISSASNSSQSTARSSSRSSIEGALLDITNLTHSQSNTSVPTTEEAAPSAATVYTPAAVAARRRRLAEMESKRESSFTPKKQKPNESTEGTSASQSQSYSQPQSQSREHTMVLPPSTSVASTADAVGLQTTMIQMLQCQQRMDSSLTRLTSAVREGQSLAHRDAFATHQVFMQKLNETLETKLDNLTKRYEAMEKKVDVLERDKQALQEQLVAAETEVYVYKKTVEEMMPQLSAQVLEAMEKGARAQNNAAHLMEARISAIHDALEEIRHLSGERTENDDSPPKKCSIFPDDSFSPQTSQRRTHTPAVLYPQTIVRELEQKLHDVVQENTSLHHRVTQLEDKLKKSEANAHRIQELSMAILRDHEPEEESKTE